jgi:hypothetical protein
MALTTGDGTDASESGMTPTAGSIRPNRIADDPVQGDDVDAIIALMYRPG